MSNHYRVCVTEYVTSTPKKKLRRTGEELFFPRERNQDYNNVLKPHGNKIKFKIIILLNNKDYDLSLRCCKRKYCLSRQLHGGFFLMIKPSRT